MVKIKNNLLIKLLVFLLYFFTLPLNAQDLAGQVVRVIDGDTIAVLTADNTNVRVRLAEIDTPEKKQPYGAKAKQALSDLVFDKPVTVTVHTIDRYGRTVGRVFVGSIDVCAELVRAGAAWVYRKYATDQHLFELETAARQAKVRLWALPTADQTPPWEWRKLK